MSTKPIPAHAESPFRSHGTNCAAWLYSPANADRPAPIIVMAHGFGGVRGIRLPAYAERFAAAGYRVLVFDYRYFGDSGGEPRQLLHIPRQQEDWRTAVRHARSLPGVDPARVVLWGTSLSGGHVLATAARDHGVAAVIAQVPHVSGIAAAASVGPVQSVRLGVRAIADLVGGWADREPLYIPAVGAPGDVAAMTSADALPGHDRLIAESGIEPPAKQVAARVILQMCLYSPGRRASALTCPALVQIAEQDVITPAKTTARIARRIPDVEIKQYPGHHFAPYVPPAFETVVHDQLDFLRRRVPAN